MMMKSLFAKFTGALALAFAAGAALAQPAAFPSKPVTLVVPFAPGGITDGLGRLIAGKLGERWKQTVIVDNRPGGGTIVGTKAVTTSAPDGHTLLLTSFGYVINQSLHDSLPYQPKDLAPLNLVGLSPNVLYLHPKVPVNNVAELVAYAKANPGKLMFASSGNATSPHIAAELFGSLTRTSVVHVPYRGTGPAMTDVLGGQVSGIFDTMQSMPYAKDGRLKAIAVANDARLSNALDVPTFEEAGLPGMVTASWFGFLVPSATPEAVRTQLFGDIREVLEQPDVKAKIVQLGVEPRPQAPGDFQRFLDRELERWTALTRERKIKLN